TWERERFPTAGRVPHPGSPSTAGDNSPAVRGKGDRLNRTVAKFEREQFLAASRLPHLGCPTVTPGDDSLAIRGEGHSVNIGEHERFPTAGRVPHLGSRNTTAGDNSLAVRGKGDNVHRAVPALQEGLQAEVSLPLPVIPFK